MEFELPEDLVAFRDVTREFATERIAPHAREWDANKWIPEEVVAEAGRIGLLGVTTPEEYGGVGQTMLAMSVVIEEIARWDGSFALLIEAHNGLCLQHLNIAASHEQKKRYVPDLASGKMIGSWCLSEPDCGTDAEALTTRAEKTSAGWVLNGQKLWVTSGKRAGLYIVMARTKPERGSRTISAFIVERGAKGMEIGEPEDKMGMRSTDTVPVSFDHCEIPEENLVGELHQGYIDALKVLDEGRFSVGAISVGLARGCLEETLKYAAERKAFGKPLHAHQAVQFKLADMETEIEAARILVRQAAAAHDAGRPDKERCCMAKLLASEMASRVGWDAIQIFGGAGYTKDFCVERLLRDNKLCEIGEGTSEVQRMLIAREQFQRRSA
ncbi:MAG: acyl-CoA dehydrogenase family protein [Phycisphaerae bacterium]|nr:acyl-CoA dehydrogenase family protein [Phycisphaerae bacterium]